LALSSSDGGSEEERKKDKKKTATEVCVRAAPLLLCLHTTLLPQVALLAAQLTKAMVSPEV
jgi:hypothetical protein